MKLWFKLALRNLRSGLRGFWILLSCLTLGVAAIAMIGSLASSVSRGLSEQGQVLLGGDIAFSLVQREAKPEELAFLSSKGQVGETANMRAMAQGGGASTLVELKAVAESYPLYGSLQLEPAVKLDASSVAVDPLLLSRLHLKLGNEVKLGAARFKIAATITTEPDRIASGIIFGPRLMMTRAALDSAGLIQPGSLVTYAYTVKLPQPSTLSAGKAVEKEAQAKFPEAGWRVRTTDKAAQGADEFVGRLSTFMTLVSIAALVIGGAGIANAVSAFISRRRETIAILKCLGVPNRDVMAISLIEILLVSVLGLALALALGAATPWLVHTLLGSLIPLPLSLAFDPQPLIFAAVLGLLVTVAFSLWPLSRIAAIKGAALFRAQGVEPQGLPPRTTMAVSFVLLLVASAITLFSFDEKRVTAAFIGGLAASFVVLVLLSLAVVKLVGMLPKPKGLLLRQALASLNRPGAASTSVIMALGLGLSLFVTLALTDQTISRELSANLPKNAPAFFFIDVQGNEFDAFKTKLAAQPGIADISNSPMLRGRISKVKGVPADEVKSKPDGAWALKGDRGLTFSDDLPKGSTLVSGKWWAKDYAGPPLVSMSDDIADSIGVTLGDKITVNVLGRDVEATVASTRKVNWKSMAINFVLVFNRAALEGAPHSEVVTAEMKGGDEGQVLNAMAEAFPSVTSVRVKDALQTVGDLLGKMLAAVRGANVISLLTGVLVLAGALAAGLSMRSYEAVVLKTYGATRGQLLGAFIIEYGLLGLVSAVFGIVVGGIASWFLARFALDMPFQFSPLTALVTAALAMVITIAAGLIVTVRALSAKPSFYLRNE
ncbi:ABC transporter permease [Aestuariivirga litoralis]|uniref:ABC transporter permease n=1 Tax=Aestuariivirga litoralis TaxID=2650924 RepID=UPI0018C72B65|nr:FtsX-like permease family protein [Aestuariivirga litoralis]MBG1233671.1 FtsX-like permease family protein [Aestuariivirga litoralis]